MDVPRRRVALKLVGFSEHDAVAAQRFGAECDALAKLDHRGIARVFDAGRLDDGRGFIAMELAVGLRIDLHCNQRRLSIRERLRLFHELTEAMAHAHARGVVHRDIKPDNVLVADVDGTPTVKVIDFGVALELDRRAQWTKTREILGTEAYLSPEQARAIPGPVDARSDVYSLGTLLYLLLAGDLPYSEAAGYHPAVNSGGQGQLPRRPSERFADGDAEWLAQQRGAVPGELRRELESELDWIVLRALEVRPEDRYRDAGEFAREIARVLEGQPAAAAPPSLRRRTRNFVRRNRSLVAAITVLFAALAVYASAATRSALAAHKSLSTLSTHNGLIHRLLDTSTQELGRTGDTSAVLRELDESVSRANQELAEAPEELASLLRMFSSAFGNLGDYDRECSLLEESLLAWDKVASPDPVAHGAALAELSAIYESSGRSEEVEQLIERGIETLQRADETNELALSALHGAYQIAGHNAMRQGKFAAATEFLSRSRETLERSGLDAHEQRADFMVSWGLLAWTQGNLDEAEQRMQAASEFAEQYVSESNSVLVSSLSDLALIRVEQGDAAGANEPSRRAVELADDLFKSRPPANAIFVMTRFEWAVLAGETALARECLERWGTLRSRGDLDELLARVQHARLALAESRSQGSEQVAACESEVRTALDDLIEAVGAFPTLVRRVNQQLGASTGADR